MATYEDFKGIAMAVDLQGSGYGTRNATIAALSGSLDEDDGIIYGVRDAGTAESGITIPEFTPIVREVVAVGGSWTERADAFLRAAVNGFTVKWPVQGNGVTSTPSAGQAKPFVGPHALYTMAGLTGANGTSPVYEYTPTTSGISYGTIKFWLGDLSFVLAGCLAETLKLEILPGGNVLAEAAVRVGYHDPSVDFADGVSFPTLDFGTWESMAAPVVEGDDVTYGTARGINTGLITLAQSIEEWDDSSVPTTGKRLSKTRMLITFDGKYWVHTADSDFEYQQLMLSTAPTEDMTVQIGAVAGATDTINAMKLELFNVQPKGLTYDRGGDVMLADVRGAKCTHPTTPGGEFKLTFN